MNEYAVVLTTLVVGACLASTSRAADVTATWNGTSGNWSDASRWLPDNKVPDNSAETFDAVISSGTVTQDISAGVTIEKLILNGGTLTGDFDVTLNDVLAWNNSTMSGAGTTLAKAGGTLTATVSLNRTLHNEGTLGWTAGNLNSAGGEFRNKSGGMVNVSGTSNRTSSANLDFINESGATITKSGTHSTRLNQFTNGGNLIVNAGFFELAGTSSSSGTYTSSGTGLIRFLAGTHTITGDVVDAALRFDGGALAVQSGSFSASEIRMLTNTNNVTFTTGSAVQLGNLEMLGGVSSISGTDHMNAGSVTLNSMTFNSSGTLTTTGGGSIGATIQLNGTLHNEGVLNWTGGNLNSTGGEFRNKAGGTINVSGTSTRAAVASLDFINENGATITKTGTSSVTINSIANDGVLNVDDGQIRLEDGSATTGTLGIGTGGTLHFGTGTHTVSGELQLAGGAVNGSAFDIQNGLLLGSGTVNAPANVNGTLGPGNSAGIVQFTDSLTLGAAAVSQFQLGGTLQGAEYDFVDANSLALGGALDVSFFDNFHTSVLATDQFVIYDATSQAGAFTNVANGAELSTSDGKGFFTVHYGAGSLYDANQVVLTDFRAAEFAVPEPSSYVLLSLGAIGLSAVARRRRRSQVGREARQINQRCQRPISLRGVREE